jgi:RNase H-fold protein (predicted Holliday junction resolvase)
MEKKQSILQQAHDIVFERNEEKSRQYGEFIEGMEQTARIASEMSRKEITTHDAYNVLIALKLSRASWNYKQDNYLDALAYMASLDQYLSTKNR